MEAKKEKTPRKSGATAPLRQQISGKYLSMFGLRVTLRENMTLFLGEKGKEKKFCEYI